MQGDGVRELLAAAREMGCDYLENEPMRLHTTFKIGGPARVLLFPETEEQITALVQCAKANGVRLLTIGNGSNLLVSDKGIDAAVLVMDKHFSAVTVKGNTIFAQAGASLMKVCRTALEHSLTGLEFAYGIPGSCGGAAFMNAGAYGGEIETANRVSWQGRTCTCPIATARIMTTAALLPGWSCACSPAIRWRSKPKWTI